MSHSNVAQRILDRIRALTDRDPVQTGPDTVAAISKALALASPITLTTRQKDWIDIAMATRAGVGDEVAFNAALDAAWAADDELWDEGLQASPEANLQRLVLITLNARRPLSADLATFLIARAKLAGVPDDTIQAAFEACLPAD